jgi:hypothetical protein
MACTTSFFLRPLVSYLPPTLLPLTTVAMERVHSLVRPVNTASIRGDKCSSTERDDSPVSRGQERLAIDLGIMV